MNIFLYTQIEKCYERMVDGYDSRIIKYASYEYGQSPKYSRGRNKSVTDTDEIEDELKKLTPSGKKEPESQRIVTQKQLKKSLQKKNPIKSAKKPNKKITQKNKKDDAMPSSKPANEQPNSVVIMPFDEESLDASTYKIVSDFEQDPNLLTSTPKAGQAAPKNVDSNR